MRYVEQELAELDAEQAAGEAVTVGGGSIEYIVSWHAACCHLEQCAMFGYVWLCLAMFGYTKHYIVQFSCMLVNVVESCVWSHLSPTQGTNVCTTQLSEPIIVA